MAVGSKSVETTTTGPLAGLTVLDLSRVLAGPWCTQILADMGAEVIKIERPERGDDTRHWGPPFVTHQDGTKGDAAYYHAINRNKKSVCLDLHSAEGQEAVRRLAARADIVVENFKTGALARLGLDDTALRAINPRLIYCSITGFGHTGPYKDRPGYDLLLQAMGGMMSVTGDPDTIPGGHPTKVGVPISDLTTGLYATVAILGALQHRHRTGEGQHIDLALLDVTISMLGNHTASYLSGGVVPQRQGNAHMNVVPYQDFPTADGHMILAIGNDGQFERFCRVAGCEDLWADETMRTNEGRIAGRDRLIPRMAEATRARTTAAWIALLEENGVPCGPINTVADALNDPQTEARGTRVRLPHSGAGELDLVANPIRYAASPCRYTHASPLLGEHTQEVLDSLGLGAGKPQAPSAS